MVAPASSMAWSCPTSSSPSTVVPITSPPSVKATSGFPRNPSAFHTNSRPQAFQPLTNLVRLRKSTLIRELSKDEFLATFAGPMRRLEAGESYKSVNLRDYVEVCLHRLNPPVTSDQSQIHHVYLNGD